METVSTEQLMERLSRIEDRLAVGDVITHFCGSLDTGDWDAMRACFTENVHVQHGAVAPPMHDREAFVSVAQHFMPQMNVQHYVTNVEPIPEGDEARCYAFVLAIHDVNRGQGRELIPAGARYNARLRRTDDGWRMYELIIDETWEDDRVAEIYAE